eukprot:13094212-Ditylum_brightwellii.AAC.1
MIGQISDISNRSGMLFNFIVGLARRPTSLQGTKHKERLLKYLKSIVGKVLRIFYHTNHVTNKVKANMHKAGVDHKC